MEGNEKDSCIEGRRRVMHLYPGMGATSEMYSGVWRTFPNAIYHDWPVFEGESTLQELAARLIVEHRIEQGDIVVGSSLGGMVACEIANQLDLYRLVLIGSAISKSEVNRLLALLSPLIDFAPIEFLKMSAGKLPHELSDMFSGSDPRFIRSMCKAIFLWDGLVSDVTVTRIHGKNDLVIPLPDGVDVVLEGGHLIAMTHSQECVGLILELENRVP